VIAHPDAPGSPVPAKSAVDHRWTAVGEVGHAAATELSPVSAEPAGGHRRIASNLVVHPPAFTRCIPDERAFGDHWVAVLVLHPPTIAEPTRFVPTERAVGHLWATITVGHPATIVFRHVAAERAVGHHRGTILAVHPPTMVAAVPAKRAVGYHRAPAEVVHTTTAIILVRTVGVPAGDSEAVENSRTVSPVGGHHVVAVFVVVGEIWSVVATEISAENRRVQLDVTFVRVTRPCAVSPRAPAVPAI